MLQWLDSVASDSRCPNSPLIDFNGEILILFWSRSASKGQIICWGNAGHSALVQINHFEREHQREKKRGGEKIRTSIYSAFSIKAEQHRGVQISCALAPVHMNANYVFIEWECSANHI